MLQKMKDLYRSQKGAFVFAREEAILVAGMVSSIAAFAGVAISWDSMFGSTTQMVDDLIQIEMANSQFFERHRIWPHQTTNGDPAKNASALVTPFAMRAPYSNLQSFKNLLPGFDMESKTYRLRHKYGDGGFIKMQEVSMNDATYLQVILENVPIREAEDVDKRIDGEVDPLHGRVTLHYDNENKRATLYYLANQI